MSNLPVGWKVPLGLALMLPVIVMVVALVLQSMTFLQASRSDVERTLTTVARAGVPVFTASFGATDSTAAGTVEELLRLADAALLDAKAQGRDRGGSSWPTAAPSGCRKDLPPSDDPPQLRRMKRSAWALNPRHPSAQSGRSDQRHPKGGVDPSPSPPPSSGTASPSSAEISACQTCRR